MNEMETQGEQQRPFPDGDDESERRGMRRRAEAGEERGKYCFPDVDPWTIAAVGVDWTAAGSSRRRGVARWS